MTEKKFVIHACEQVLRFTRVENWDNLSGERKVQLGFNMGVMAFGLSLTKEESFIPLSDAREGKTSMLKYRERMKALVATHNIPIDQGNVNRPF